LKNIFFHKIFQTYLFLFAFLHRSDFGLRFLTFSGLSKGKEQNFKATRNDEKNQNLVQMEF